MWMHPYLHIWRRILFIIGLWKFMFLYACFEDLTRLFFGEFFYVVCHYINHRSWLHPGIGWWESFTGKHHIGSNHGFRLRFPCFPLKPIHWMSHLLVTSHYIPIMIPTHIVSIWSLIPSFNDTVCELEVSIFNMYIKHRAKIGHRKP